MKINWHLVDYDMLDEIQLPSCPSMFRTQAEMILWILARTEPITYLKMSQFDKHLIYEYWRQVDGLDRILQGEHPDFKQWFMTQATMPELIRRARQWLIEKNYLIPSQGVENRAQEAGTKWRKGVKA